MRFLLDENFPKAAIGFLESKGHEAFDVRGTAKEGIPDSELFRLAQSLEAVILTTDRDFFHTLPHLHENHRGIVVVALRQPNRAAILSRLEWLLSHVAPGDFNARAFQLRDSTWVVVPPLG